MQVHDNVRSLLVTHEVKIYKDINVDQSIYNNAIIENYIHLQDNFNLVEGCTV